MILDYIYHSGFAIEAEGVTLIIDYYKDSSETELNTTVCSNVPENCMCLPHISIPTTSTGKY
mgnify:CR=1 FL=1